MGERKNNLHGVTRLVVENGVVEDQTHELDKGLERGNGVRLQLRADSAEVHGMLDDREIVGNALRNRIDGSHERSRVLAFLRLRMEPTATSSWRRRRSQKAWRFSGLEVSFFGLMGDLGDLGREVLAVFAGSDGETTDGFGLFTGGDRLTRFFGADCSEMYLLVNDNM